MSYLRLTRTRLIFACFLMLSLLLWGVPAIDLTIARFFFDAGFDSKGHWWYRWIHQGMVCFLCLSMAVVVGVYLCNRWLRRDLLGIDGKKVCYLFLVLILGAGLVVNVILKNDFGRARPRDIEEFGGSKHFTPAFVVSRECDRNCSFSSGEGAAGFFALALALALSKRRSVFLASVGFGSLVSFCRIASGAHFLSDTVVSFFVMLILADVLYHYMLCSKVERLGVPVQLLPGVVVRSS